MIKPTESTLYTYTRNGKTFSTPDFRLACSRMEGNDMLKTTYLGNRESVVKLEIEDLEKLKSNE